MHLLVAAGAVRVHVCFLIAQCDLCQGTLDQLSTPWSPWMSTGQRLHTCDLEDTLLSCEALRISPPRVTPHLVLNK